MIAKPKDWDTAQAFTGEGQAMTPGGHVVRILSMRQEVSRNNRPMVVLTFDIDEGGELDGFYRRQYDAARRTNDQVKWRGVIRYMLYAKDGEHTNGFFKGLIDAIEKSNPGWRWGWDESACAGRLVGMVFGEEEYRAQDGSVRVSVKAQQARSVQAIREGVPVPERKRLPKEEPGYAPFDPGAGFTRAEEPLPWEV